MLHSDVCIEALAYELPPNVVSSASIYDRLAPTLKRLGVPAEWIGSLSGVEERRFWNPGTRLSEVAASAARKALERSGVRPDQVGILISTSVSKEYLEPSLACMVHGALGLSERCLNFDVGNACLAFLNGMSLVAERIERGEILAGVVVDAECSRDITEATVGRLQGADVDLASFSKQFAALTLGSGAVAAVLTHRSIARSSHRLVGHVSLSDTRFCNLCLGKATEMLTEQSHLLKAGVALAQRTWQLATSTFGWTRENVTQFICHQVGSMHHKALFEHLGLDPSRSFLTFPFLGNVGPASVPLTLAMAAERGRIRPGDRVALMGIGSGLNCSMMEVQW